MVCLLKGLFFCLGFVFCANTQPYFSSLFKRSCSFFLLPIAIFYYQFTTTFCNKLCSKLNKRQKKHSIKLCFHLARAVSMALTPRNRPYTAVKPPAPVHCHRLADSFPARRPEPDRPLAQSH